MRIREPGPNTGATTMKVIVVIQPFEHERVQAFADTPAVTITLAMAAPA